jgi:predicted MFS family arabinose efflux permease
MFTAVGMAAGGWLAGILYDYFGYYLPAFATGVGANVLNILIIGALVIQRRRQRPAYA